MYTRETPLAPLVKASKKKDAVARLGLDTVGDLLEHHPRRYLDTSTLTRVRDLHPGQVVVVVGRVTASARHPYQDRRTKRRAFRVQVRIETEGPTLGITLFASNAGRADYWERRLHVGAQGLFAGQLSLFNGAWQLTHPDYVLFDDDEGGRRFADDMPALFPVYPLTKNLQSWDLQRAMSIVLEVLPPEPERVPAWLRDEHHLITRDQAVRWIHAPDDYRQVGAARRQFRFEEALTTQILLLRRRAAQRAQGGRRHDGGGGLLAAFDARLPFPLTGDQRHVGAEIDADLAAAYPMNRLLQGEVGSGKTLVAVRAMLRVIDSGAQAVLLAPTEVLAAQHERAITALLGDLAAGGMLGGADEGTTVALLTGSQPTAVRREAMLRIASGEAGIVIGTHALLEDKVSFADLGLVVVDEQHRFGVDQRAALTGKAKVPPDVLVMTATPIPRTVAMTVFGDLETSTITELPAGRAEITTNLVPLATQPHWLGRVWQRIAEEVAKGHQVYVVCPRIGGEVAEEGQTEAADPVWLDDLDPDVPDDFADFDDDEGSGGQPDEPKRPAAGVEEVLPGLVEGPLAGLRVAPLHGRLPADEKDATMRAFAAGRIDVLVATTVIEVGVDVANATMMVILDADRFGVSQLHQLRGRVGRGGLPGLCLLVSGAADDSPALARLEAVAATVDGFELSRVDLENRREGDVLGADQSGGRTSLRRLAVLRDEDTILAARAAAEALLERDPDLDEGEESRRLGALVAELEHSAAADFVEKS